MPTLILLSSLNFVCTPENPREYRFHDANRRLRSILGAQTVYTDVPRERSALHFQTRRYVPHLAASVTKTPLRENSWLSAPRYYYGSPALTLALLDQCESILHVAVREVYPGQEFLPSLENYVEVYRSIHLDPEGFEYEYSELVRKYRPDVLVPLEPITSPVNEANLVDNY